MSKKRFTVTAALLYANGPLHIGHIAGAYLPADIYVRYLKSKGHDVAFICGSDEHGAAITLKAKKDNVTPKEIIDKYHLMNKKTFEDFGINFSIYHRTSEKIHHKTAQDFFITLNQKNSFTKKSSKQFYDQENDLFLADRYVTGECPKCGYKHAYGDQCEKCGATLSPDELINPKSALTGSTPIKKETTHWYLPMQKHERWLKEWIENGKLNNMTTHDPKAWRKQVIGQCKSWIKGGLKERAMTRDLKWGVKVPVKSCEGKVLYVWLDAPIGYISATKEWAKVNKKNWEDYWKNQNTNLVHFIGKDNIVFHCIMFPIILKEHGEYILPNNVPANEFLNLEGNKLSTSKGWAIWAHEYLQDFKDQQDALRYVLCATSPETKDTDFTWNDFQSRNNNELVSIFGNFINRVLVLSNKYWNGVVPAKNNLTEIDKEIICQIDNTAKIVGAAVEKFKFREALAELINLSRIGNKYLADTEPWKIQKTNNKRVETIMNIAIQITGTLAVLCNPFLPFTSEKLFRMLNLAKKSWDDAGSTIISSQHKLNKPTHLFTKIDDDKIELQKNKLHL